MGNRWAGNSFPSVVRINAVGLSIILLSKPTLQGHSWGERWLIVSRVTAGRIDSLRRSRRLGLETVLKRTNVSSRSRRHASRVSCQSQLKKFSADICSLTLPLRISLHWLSPDEIIFTPQSHHFQTERSLATVMCNADFNLLVLFNLCWNGLVLRSKHTSKLRSATCHIESRSVSCHPPQENAQKRIFFTMSRLRPVLLRKRSVAWSRCEYRSGRSVRLSGYGDGLAGAAERLAILHGAWTRHDVSPDETFDDDERRHRSVGNLSLYVSCARCVVVWGDDLPQCRTRSAPTTDLRSALWLHIHLYSPYGSSKIIKQSNLINERKK